MTATKKIIIGIVVVTIAILGWWLFLQNSEVENGEVADVPPVSEANIRIIAFGDSLTAGYGLPLAESYPAQLEAMLIRDGYDVSVINAGVSGETTRGNVERVPFIRKQSPDIVLLGIGGNDALRQLPISETKKNIVATIEALQSGENPPVVILLKMQSPLSAGAEYKDEFDAMYQEFSNIYNLPLVPFITPEVFLDTSKKLPDGIHLNREGYEVVVREYILPTVIDVLASRNE